MRWACVLFCLATFAVDAAMPVRNADFAAWMPDGKPAGWGLGEAATFKAARDCEAPRLAARCHLRLDGRPTPSSDFIPVAQALPLGEAAGHVVRLDGYIRTQSVSGYAGLWIRVDGANGVALYLDDMRASGPRGTTGWRRYEATIPVPPNARQIVFGVLLQGGGSAWFDALSLEVDAASRVERVVVPEIVPPPRPVAGKALLDDAALALEPADLPAVAARWKDEARRVVKPIRSLAADDTSDLEFLRPLLAGKRVVQLGESAHGAAEFNWLKVRLAKYLHRELGFDVLAFESPAADCDRADALAGTSPPVDVMKACLYDVWHTEEVLPLFEFVDAERRAGRRFAIAGFDVQERGRPLAPLERDAGMAGQLEALLDAKYPGRKVIVWAHNFHVAKDRARDMGRTMGTWTAERRGAEVYTIAMYMGRGVGAQNDRTLYEIKRAPDNSLEAILASAGFRYAFADLGASGKPAGSWMNEVLVAREWGAGITHIVPSRAYDGVVYVDTATPPRYR